MITATEMRQREKAAITQGISLQQLMENAGKAVAEVILERYEPRHVIIFAGPGNNGGDGFVAARYLQEQTNVVILFFGNEQKLSEEAKKNYDLIKEEIFIQPIACIEDLQQLKFQGKLLLVDALLGTGTSGKLREPISFAIDYFNRLPGTKVAIDIPSGMNPDTGEVEETACNVDLIICFHDLKTGLQKIRENVIIKDIGIPPV